MPSDESQFSAAQQALGYSYQIRFALLQTMRLPEDISCFIEKDDDVDFTDPEEGKILASLKHKAPGDSLSDLSPDFWKSVRIWVNYYIKNEMSAGNVSFFLVTTGSVAVGSLLEAFLPNALKSEDLTHKIADVLGKSTSKTILKTKELLYTLPQEEWLDFFRHITIFDNQQRIQNIPDMIREEKFRAIRPQFRIPVYERLEGWWNGECIDILCGQRKTPISGWEVSEKLASIAEFYQENNLPIDFEKAEPMEGVHPDLDQRYFVRQLRAIGLQSDRIRRAILDYYRAFEQRCVWVRESATLNGELERYDDRLVDEWDRLREIIFEELNDDSPEEILQKTGRKLINQISTNGNPNLRVRQGVTATFVTMGSYHMLANDRVPRVYWHPRFQERIEEIFMGECHAPLESTAS